jgi:hypothetical protein
MPTKSYLGGVEAGMGARIDGSESDAASSL